jgi:hypothetical protein
LHGYEPRLGARDLLGARAHTGFLECRRRRLRASVGLLDLFRSGAFLQLVEVGHRPFDLRFGHEALSGQIGRLDLDEGLARRHAVAFLRAHGFHPTAHARPDRDGPGFDRSAPLVGLRALPSLPSQNREPDDGRRDDQRQPAPQRTCTSGFCCHRR